MRKKIIAGNWKMNKTHREGMEMLAHFFKLLDFELSLNEDTGKKFPEVVVAPPYLIVADAAMLAQGWDVKIAAQNCSSEKEGAFTGEISAAMLKAVKADYVIVGHSERRAYFGETNQLVAKKIDRALESDLSVICCVGETLQERESGKQLQIISRQIEECLFHQNNEQMKNIVVAYEPVWAIGTGKNATPEQAQEIHKHIRLVIAGKFGKDISENISILYGGSCNPKNAKSIFSQPDVDGGLIGGASLNAKDFIEVIKAIL
ncbi:MAG: triose-phosphate isomerase [Bacteroidetes bacterium]|nr:triose-phosphate isomerase [Bacteroidota bacterium]